MRIRILQAFLILDRGQAREERLVELARRFGLGFERAKFHGGQILAGGGALCRIQAALQRTELGPRHGDVVGERAGDARAFLGDLLVEVAHLTVCREELGMLGTVGDRKRRALAQQFGLLRAQLDHQRRRDDLGDVRRIAGFHQGIWT